MSRPVEASPMTRDGGFTLVELIVTIVIMGVITLPLGNFVISYFTNTSTTVGRLAESHDEQFAAAFFSQDVANVGTRDDSMNSQQSVWSGSFPAGSCGASVPAANQILLLQWDNATWNGSSEDKPVYSVAYVKGVASGETQLQRIFCQGSTQMSNTVVVHNLDPAVTPAVSCSSTCTSATPPANISLSFKITSASGQGQPVAITLTGQRRQS